MKSKYIFLFRSNIFFFKNRTEFGVDLCNALSGKFVVNSVEQRFNHRRKEQIFLVFVWFDVFEKYNTTIYDFYQLNAKLSNDLITKIRQKKFIPVLRIDNSMSSSFKWILCEEICLHE